MTLAYEEMSAFHFNISASASSMEKVFSSLTIISSSMLLGSEKLNRAGGGEDEECRDKENDGVLGLRQRFFMFATEKYIYEKHSLYIYIYMLLLFCELFNDKTEMIFE